MKSYFTKFIYISLIVFSSCGKEALFKQIPSSYSDITFNNKIIENDSVNPLDMINVYNGGGVGIGDFNDDSLPDIYFTGNLVSNKLYLNKGDFKFKDITDKANVGGEGRWCRGVSVVDLNSDGWLDIYVSASISKDPHKRENLLYINQGNDKDKVPHFKEMAAAYGLNDSTHSTMANFFDYDNDGDLDVYILVNENIPTENPNLFRPILADGSHPSTGRLYRNDSVDSLSHPFFTDVSKEAGIVIEGYGHGATVTDLNQDGWMDIYVTNDFVSNNILYINNHDGTFTDKSKQYFKHTSYYAMGQDIIDINNDGLADVIELDMNPEDNYRKKMMLSANSYQVYQNFDYYGYQYQYVRNTLQVNQGPRVGQNDSVGEPIFSEIGFLSGISQTDWSWAPLVADFDNDGLRDIMVSNGYPKDVTDHDFMVFRSDAFSIASKQQILQQIPIVKLHNYAFKSIGDLKFKDVSKEWGLSAPTFSNGTSYADLDNDGDLDMVINNINDEASIYRNTSRENDKENRHYLKIKFAGSRLNRNGIGASVTIYLDHGKQQMYENSVFRGYLSSDEGIAHFGLGKENAIDSVIIKWPDGKKQLLKNVKADQLLKVNASDAKTDFSYHQPVFAGNSLFREITNSVGIHYKHTDKDFVDFNIQKLLPHKFTEYTPALAAGDVDGNGLDDIICGGSSAFPANIFLQQANGKFLTKRLRGENEIKNSGIQSVNWQDLGIVLFDVDNDADLDLYVARGGYESAPNTPAYSDKLYINNGKGSFKIDTLALPENYTSKFCVRAVDYDKDGDLDLFVSGRVDPWNYPKPVSSFIFRNDSKNGKVRFTDATREVARPLINIGLVCDALFTDYDNDGWPDLILAGEWMPLKFFKNNKGNFVDQSEKSGLNKYLGWWNTIAPGDFDNDGDIDYIAGNLGLNSFYKASDQEPVNIIAKDFDNNGSYDALPSLFLPNEKGENKEFPAHTRDDVVKQMISMRAKFQNYKSFAMATMDQVLTQEQQKGALRLTANFFSSCFLRNEGKGKFSLNALPVEAQVSVLNGISTGDFDGDGNLDVVINGNDFGTEVSVGRYDALNGLLLKGNGRGQFTRTTILQSGIFIPGNGKALVALRGAKGETLLAASQNKGPLKVLELKKGFENLGVQPFDESAIIKYKNGQAQKRELYYGASFLSQSARYLKVDKKIASVQIKDSRGKVREIKLD